MRVFCWWRADVTRDGRQSRHGPRTTWTQSDWTATSTPRRRVSSKTPRQFFRPTNSTSRRQRHPAGQLQVRAVIFYFREIIFISFSFHLFAYMSYQAVTYTQVRNINERNNKAQNKLALTVALDKQK